MRSASRRPRTLTRTSSDLSLQAEVTETIPSVERTATEVIPPTSRERFPRIPVDSRRIRGSAGIAAVLFLSCVVCIVAPHGASAQSIDYDPRRPEELRACDEHQHHGRIDQARQCYAQLLGASNLTTQAEAAWAIGDIRSANELFRRVVQSSKRAVQPRVRWGRLFLQTHQYADAVALFREAVISGDPLPGWDFFTAVGILAIITGLVAALIPALAAARRDPLKELRVP